MIVVVFESQAKAWEGFRVLKDLDREGEISVYEAEAIAKEPDGEIRVMDGTDKTGLPTIGGFAAVGALVGLLGGPVGALIGAAAGTAIGTFGHLEESGVGEEFVNDVSKTLTSGKAAVVADVDEDWVTPLDTRMEAIGGVVFRRERSFVQITQDERDVAAHRAEMDQLKAERLQAKADRLAKIDGKIDNLRAKIEAAIERKRAKMQLRQQQRNARIQILEAKASEAQGELRKRQEARIAEVRRVYAEQAPSE
jgi:uncharacterized membrane protein